MYNYEWDTSTGGYILTTQTGRFVANELRPVFAEELRTVGLHERFIFDAAERRPFLWARKNVYFYRGEKIAETHGMRYGKTAEPVWHTDKRVTLLPVDLKTMTEKNAAIMRALTDDTKRRLKELYDEDIARCDCAYIAFSGGKDSVVLLHLCGGILPLNVPVIFSDTDMELPDTYAVWNHVREAYPGRSFVRISAQGKALDNWYRFGPPSRSIRWCCSIHKSTPAVIYLKERLGKASIRVMAFVGVRGEESYSRSFYEDASDGLKNESQLNRMPILEWGSHELWQYIFANGLRVNDAYRKGLSRVGCALCPESSEKHIWMVNAAYPGLMRPYEEAILKTGARSFSSREDAEAYIGELGWQARKSGVLLQNTLLPPIERTDGLTCRFRSASFDRDLFFTWILPVGEVLKDGEMNCLLLRLPRTQDGGIPFTCCSLPGGGGEVVFRFRTEEERLSVQPLLRTVFRKVSACVACRACEAECTYGALYYEGGRMHIKSSVCVRCRKCFDKIDNGCWRYQSMRVPDETKSPVAGINAYKTFGLREKGQYLWLSTLVEMREHFFPWIEGQHPLGNKMVDAAYPWFSQAGLIDRGKSPTNLVDFFERYGCTSKFGWELIWMSLANRSILIKWFVTSVRIGETCSVERLGNLLRCGYPDLRDSTIKGALAALRDFISKSPVGVEDTHEPSSRSGRAFVRYEMKGKSVVSITRLSREIHLLTILYGLYLMASLSDSSAFTVTGMLSADIHSAYVSPITAFGLNVDWFKKACEGLRSRYPDYISTTFTHGNDEVHVFPEKFSAADIIDLAIREGDV